ncbi:hypothetical protein ACHAXT_010087 [Thalassiosira profunda]
MSSTPQLRRPHGGVALGGRPLGGVGAARGGVGASAHRPSPSRAPLLLFRVVAVTIIALCILWAYLIVKIATDDGASYSGGLRPNSLLARPHLHAPEGKNRLGWMIRQKIDRMKLQLHPVSLLDVSKMDSPILILACKRADYLERTLWKVLEYHPALAMQRRRGDLRSSASTKSEGKNDRLMGAPIIVSQDGHDKAVKAVIEEYRQLFEMRLGLPLYRIQHKQENIPTADFDLDWTRPYKMLAKHYGWALEQTFSGNAYATYQRQDRTIPTPPMPKRVIILEEDIEIALDFFSLMNATADLLDADDTLLAVSAFNDNGKEDLVADTKRLVRSDFFPGLGWMLSRTAWDGPPSHPDTGLKMDWAPGGFWDDWLRENERRWGRHIIRPEVSRTFHFGNVAGASEGENNNDLSRIELEENDVRWEKLDLSYLNSEQFADSYWGRVAGARLVKTASEAKGHVAHGDVRMVYATFPELERLAKEFRIMPDEKAGVPRTGYEGIVEIRYGRGKFFVFLTPPYVTDGGSRPAHFGRKAWRQYDKESLMKELGIEMVKAPDPFEWGQGWNR